MNGVRLGLSCVVSDPGWGLTGAGGGGLMGQFIKKQETRIIRILGHCSTDFWGSIIF